MDLSAMRYLTQSCIVQQTNRDDSVVGVWHGLILRQSETQPYS